jgi:hypothetical protein
MSSDPRFAPERLAGGSRFGASKKSRKQDGGEQGEKNDNKEKKEQEKRPQKGASSKKVAVDSRFSAMFEDPEFGGAGKGKKGKKRFDKRGRPVQSAGDDMRRFYELEEGDGSDTSSESSDDDDVVADAPQKQQSKKLSKKEAKRERLDNLLLRARGELSASSDSSSSSDSDLSESELSDDDLSEDVSSSTSPEESDEEDEGEDGDSARRKKRPKSVLVKSSTAVRGERVPIGDATSRLALMNMDWVNVRAVDLLVLLRSFASADTVRRVTVFPSEFGKKMMAQDRTVGPSAVWRERDSDDDDDSSDSGDNDDGEGEQASRRKQASAFDQKKLREYELNKLKYYYAVADCDSAETASRLYEQCDGMEVEHTGNVLDLRFIPDDFRPPALSEAHSTANKVPRGYEAREYATNVLQSSNLECTWEQETPDAHRASVTLRGVTSDLAGQHTRDGIRRASRGRLVGDNADKHGITEDEEVFKTYLAGASSSESSGDGDGSSDISSSSSSSGGEMSDNEGTAATTSTKKKSQKRKQLRDRYRQLLQGGDSASGPDPFGKGKRDASFGGENGDAGDDDDDEAFGDMEITFRPGLSAAAQELVDEKTSDAKPSAESSEWERRLARMREKKEKNKQKMKERMAERKKAHEAEVEEHRARFGKSGRRKKESEAERKEREALELLMIPEDEDEVKAMQRMNKATNETTENGVETLAHLLALEEAGETLSKRQKRLKVKHLARKRKAADVDSDDDGGEGFQVDLDEGRWGELFNNPDFAVQADHKLAKRQSETTTREITKKRIAKRQKTGASPDGEQSQTQGESSGLTEQVARLRNRLKAHPAYQRRS